MLLDLLFDEIGAGGTVTLEEIKSYAKDNPKTYTEQDQGVDRRVRGDGRLRSGMFEGDSWSWRIGMFVLAVLVGAVGFFSAMWGETVWPVLLRRSRRRSRSR